jgi:hypothetical protein
MPTMSAQRDTEARGAACRARPPRPPPAVAARGSEPRDADYVSAARHRNALCRRAADPPSPRLGCRGPVARPGRPAAGPTLGPPRQAPRFSASDGAPASGRGSGPGEGSVTLCHWVLLGGDSRSRVWGT